LDVSVCLDWLEAENGKRPVTQRLLYVVPILKAVAQALHAVPELNGTYSEGAFRPSSDVHLGMAISLRGGGLIAPALHHADQRDLDGLMRALSDLVKRARAGGLRSSELSDPTVTVTNLGDGIVDAVYPVIYPPQVAMIGLGSVMKRPWIVDDAIVPRRLIQVTVAADHRVSDGHRAARFLERLGQLLAEPETL
jgi:pyruvate dehydrogenase E2 component (dihydrolipoamide acetyltransferase)